MIVCVKYASLLVLSSTCHFLTDNRPKVQSADKNQQESRAVVTGKETARMIRIEICSGIARSTLWIARHLA